MVDLCVVVGGRALPPDARWRVVDAAGRVSTHADRAAAELYAVRHGGLIVPPTHPPPQLALNRGLS